MSKILGGRAREELALSPTVTGVLGLAAEMTKINAYTENFDYLQTGALAPVTGFRPFWSITPIGISRRKPRSPGAPCQNCSRFSGVLGLWHAICGPAVHRATGLSRRRLGSSRRSATAGFDIGGDWTPCKNVKVSFTGFYEWYQNEQLSMAGTSSPPLPTRQRAGLRPSRRGSPIDGSPSKDGVCSPITPTTTRYSRTSPNSSARAERLATSIARAMNSRGRASRIDRTGRLRPAVRRVKGSEPMSNMSTRAPITSTTAMS